MTRGLAAALCASLVVCASWPASRAQAETFVLDQPLTEAPERRGGLISTLATGGEAATQIATGFSLNEATSVSAIEWWGGPESPATDPLLTLLELRVFDDDEGLPATTARLQASLVFELEASGFDTGNGDAILKYRAPLDPPLELSTGAQWLSIVQVAQTPGNWLWVSSDELPVSIADRFGGDATPWTGGLEFRGNRAVRLIPEPNVRLGALGSITALGALARGRRSTRLGPSSNRDAAG